MTGMPFRDFMLYIDQSGDKYSVPGIHPLSDTDDDDKMLRQLSGRSPIVGDGADQIASWRSMVIRQYGGISDEKVSPILKAFEAASVFRAFQIERREDFIVCSFMRGSIGDIVLPMLRWSVWPGVRFSICYDDYTSRFSIDLLSVVISAHVSGVSVEQVIETLANAIAEIALAVWSMENDIRRIKYTTYDSTKVFTSIRYEYGSSLRIKKRIRDVVGRAVSTIPTSDVSPGSENIEFRPVADLVEMIAEIEAWSKLNSGDDCDDHAVVSLGTIRGWFGDNEVVPPKTELILSPPLRQAWERMSRTLHNRDYKWMKEHAFTLIDHIREDISMAGLHSDKDTYLMLAGIVDKMAPNQIPHLTILDDGIAIDSDKDIGTWMKRIALSSILFEFIPGAGTRHGQFKIDSRAIIKAIRAAVIHNLGKTEKIFHDAEEIQFFVMFGLFLRCERERISLSDCCRIEEMIRNISPAIMELRAAGILPISESYTKQMRHYAIGSGIQELLPLLKNHNIDYHIHRAVDLESRRDHDPINAYLSAVLDAMISAHI